MEVSRVSVHPDTLRFTKMSRGKKAKLREQNVIELLKSKPYGSKTSIGEIMGVSGYSSGQAAYSLIKRLCKRGVVTIQERHGRLGNVYTVNGEVMIRSAGIPAQEKSVTAMEDTPSHELIEVPAPVVANQDTVDIAALKRKAMEFAWLNDSDSLREFVKYVVEEAHDGSTPKF